MSWRRWRFGGITMRSDGMIELSAILFTLMPFALRWLHSRGKVMKDLPIPIVCPDCRESDASVGTIDVITFFRYRGLYGSFTTGTIPCRCGAMLSIEMGRVTNHIPAEKKGCKRGA